MKVLTHRLVVNRFPNEVLTQQNRRFLCVRCFGMINANEPHMFRWGDREHLGCHLGGSVQFSEYSADKFVRIEAFNPDDFHLR